MLLVVFVEKRSSKCLKKISININILQALKKFIKSQSSESNERLFLSIEKDGIYLNKAKIVSCDAKKQYIFLYSLLKLQINGTLKAQKIGLKWQSATENINLDNK